MTNKIDTKEALIAFLQLNGFKYNDSLGRYSRILPGSDVPYNMVVVLSSRYYCPNLLPNEVHIRYDLDNPNSIKWADTQTLPVDEAYDFISNFLVMHPLPPEYTRP